LKRVEAEIGEELAFRPGFYRSAADALEDVNRVLLKSIGRSDRFGSLGQASKCSMNAGTDATAEPVRASDKIYFTCLVPPLRSTKRSFSPPALALDSELLAPALPSH
jgi:hypothetical protein